MRTDLQRLKRDSESGRYTTAKSGGATAASTGAIKTVDTPSSQTGGALCQKKRWAFIAAVAPVLIAALAGGGLYYRSRQSKPLTEKDTIVIADFDNSTRDPVFDDTLKTASRVALNQSPFLSALSDTEVTETLQLMTRPTDTKLTPDVAREFASALIARLTSRDRLPASATNTGGIKAVGCRTGDVLAQEQVAASSKEKVLNAMGKAAAKLRGELGESLATVQKYDVPLSERNNVFA